LRQHVPGHHLGREKVHQFANGDCAFCGRIAQLERPFYQCLVGERVVLVDRMRRRVIDEEELVRKRGIRPSHVADWLALVGDAADGFPGIAGFGEKTAAALLRAFGHLEGIPRRAAEWPTGIRQADRLAATLAEHMEAALLYRKLATLIEDVPLAEDLDALAWRGVPRQEFEAWCERLGAGDLRDRPRRWQEPRSGPPRS